MNIEVKAVHFTLLDETKDYVLKKIARIRNAENMIVDFLITMTKGKTFSAEAKINFRWGVTVHLKEKDFELNPAVDKLLDKVEQKIVKEKEKVKEKR